MPTSLLSLIDPLSKSASVSSVYGEAFTANGKTIIPVARIAYGFGAGSGRKPGESASGEGEGGGGGVYAEPVGVHRSDGRGDALYRYKRETQAGRGGARGILSGRLLRMGEALSS